MGNRGTLCSSTFAALVTIFQAGAHLGVCIWGILIYVCEISISGSIIHTLWYYTYMYRSVCVNGSLADITNSSVVIGEHEYTLDDLFKLPDYAPASQTTFEFLKAYIITDAIWLLSAVFLLIGACGKIKGKLSILFYFPWILCCFGISVFDVIVSIWYGNHISQTNNLFDWLSFIGAVNKTDINIEEVLKGMDTINFEYALMVPSILMIVIFSRLIVIWVVNAVLFFVIICNSCKEYKVGHEVEYQEYQYPNRNEVSHHDNPYHNGSEIHHSFQNVDYISPPEKRKEILTQNADTNSNESRIRKWQLYYGNDATDLRVHKPRTNYGVNDYLAKNGNALQQSNLKDNSDEGQPYFRARLKDPNPKAPEPKSRSYDQTGYFQPDNRISPSPGYESPTSLDSHQHMPFPPNRYNNEKTPYGGQLRSQLPWSYFQDPSRAMAPRAPSPVRGEMPPVPVPDYTLKIPGYKERKRVY